MDHFDIANTSVIMYNKLAKTNRYIIDQNLTWEEKCLQITKVAQILVQHLIFQVCAKIIENIKNIINSDDFLAKYRNSPSDFTRDRKLPFQKLLLYFLNLNKRAYQDELDSFFKILDALEIDEHQVSKAALTKARKKLNHEAFITLNHHLNALFHQSFKPNTWFGFNLLGIDGSTVQVPKAEKVADHFGTWKPRVGDPCPMARISQLFDVSNKMTLDAIISPKATGERELALRHLGLIGPEDLLLLDRGYPAFWLFKEILVKQAHFCARISNTKWTTVRKFYQSGCKEKIVSIKPSYPARIKCREMGLDINPLKLRLLRVELDTGETEILITSLLNTVTYPHCEFANLYHCRWPVEEDYKVIKRRIEVENFSGKSVLSVYQDFHAKVFSKNLTAVISFPLKEKIKQKNSHRQYDYQLNFTQALSRMKDTVVLLFSEPLALIEYFIERLHQLFLTLVEPIRPGRKYPRKAKVQRKGFYPCYKPIR